MISPMRALYTIFEPAEDSVFSDEEVKIQACIFTLRKRQFDKCVLGTVEKLQIERDGILEVLRKKRSFKPTSTSRVRVPVQQLPSF